MANYFQEGAHECVWGDPVLLYCSHFSTPTLPFCPFEVIEMGGPAVVMDQMSKGKPFTVLT